MLHERQEARVLLRRVVGRASKNPCDRAVGVVEWD